MSTTSTNSPPIPLRILMLHGYTQNPTLFRRKTSALQKHLLRHIPPTTYTLSLHYAQAPHKIPPASIPGYDPVSHAGDIDEEPEAYGWWMRKDRPDGTIMYEGLEKGLEAIADVIRREGPFVGVMGFSQGAAAAAMVASLLEGQHRKEAFDRTETEGGIPYPKSFLSKEGKGFVQGPLKFAVCYSGFRAPGKLYKAFYEPPIGTVVQCLMGQVDTVVDEGRGLELVRAVQAGNATVLFHPGGHFVPSQKMWLDVVVGFVKAMAEEEQEGPKGEEVRVEDMDMPF